MGIGNFILFAVCAQITTFAAIDYFGWFGVMPKEIPPIRAGGVMLLLVGLVTTQLQTGRESFTLSLESA